MQLLDNILTITSDFFDIGKQKQKILQTLLN